MTSRRVLVIKLKQPGDVLVSTPVIGALKAAWPESRVTYLVPKGTEDMVSGHPGLDDLMVVNRQGATWHQISVWALRDLPSGCTATFRYYFSLLTVHCSL